MKTLSIYLLTIVAWTLSADASNRPNFLLILIDDMGWKDCGFSGSEFIETPAIDRLARAGTIFTTAYSSAPN